MPSYIIDIDQAAISDLLEVTDRLMHLSEYLEESREVALTDLTDALLHYWLLADFDRLNLLLDDIKSEGPLFRDHEIFEALTRLANPMKAGYRQLNSSTKEVQKELLEVDEIITHEVKVDTDFRTIGFAIY